MEIGHDIEDIKVIASAKASHIPQCSGKPTATQIARRNLLTKKVPETSVNEGRTEFEEIVVMSDGGHFPSPHNDTSVHHHVINQLRKESLSQRSRVQTEVTQSCLKHSEQSPTGPHSTLRKFTAPGQLEHAQKKQAAQQYHVFRKYYSDLERAQARQKQLKLTHSQRVEKLKKRKEANRRVIEDEAVVNDSCSFISTEAAEDQRLAAEWAELVATESRRQEEQKSQEMERYIQALKARLKEQLESRKLDVPPLCACGLELWDTNPDTCANNCIFYKNPKGIYT